MDDLKPKRLSEDMADLPDLADIYNLAYGVIDGLPTRLQGLTKNLVVRVENFADEMTLDTINLDDKYDLLGLYRGVPLPLKGVNDSMAMPDVIFLYRGPLIRFARENGETLPNLVYHVMIHEIGHHFGYSDHDLDWIERAGK